MEGLKRRYRALPLVASPLEEHGNHHSHDQAAHQDTSREELAEKERVRFNVHKACQPFDRTPTFRELEEASSIELFYDLFFVANCRASQEYIPLMMPTVRRPFITCELVGQHC